ncbi:MAG: hypothetical protein ABJL99_20385 [Aliishimia sp.]
MAVDAFKVDLDAIDRALVLACTHAGRAVEIALDHVGGLAVTGRYMGQRCYRYCRLHAS